MSKETPVTTVRTVESSYSASISRLRGGSLAIRRPASDHSQLDHKLSASDLLDDATYSATMTGTKKSL